VSSVSTDVDRREAYCPSCGRYVGSYEVCPYCGARVRVRISLKVLAILALLLSVGGVIALYIAGKTSEAETIYIRDIEPWMNYARVKIRGYAYTSSYYDEVQGRLYFSLVDEEWSYNEHFKTYTIMVFIYAPTAREIIELGKAPVSGDKIEVIGTLRIRDSISLIVDDAEDLKLLRANPRSVSLEEISKNWTEYLGMPISVSGWVVEYENYGSFILCSLRDYFYPEFTLQVYIPEIAIKHIGELPEFFVGDKVLIVGNLWEYRGEPELVPWNGTSISIIEKLRDYTLLEVIEQKEVFADAGWIIKVNACIRDYREDYRNIIYITDNTLPEGITVTLWIYPGVWDELNGTVREGLNTKGNWIYIIGQCKYYLKEFEIAIYDVSWILDW